MVVRDLENRYLNLESRDYSAMDDWMGHSTSDRIAIGPQAGRKTTWGFLALPTGRKDVLSGNDFDTARIDRPLAWPYGNEVSRQSGNRFHAHLIYATVSDTCPPDSRALQRKTQNWS